MDRSDELIANARQLGIDAIITIGGDGSLATRSGCAKVLPWSGCPTIDNDVSGTVTTFGFDTAVNTRSGDRPAAHHGREPTGDGARGDGRTPASSRIHRGLAAAPP